MAVNNGCPGRQDSHAQSSYSANPEHDGGSVTRSRAASPASNDRSSPTVFNPYYTGRPRTPANGTKSSTIDRQEIIRRIKSASSRPTSPELERPSSSEYNRITRIKSRESRPQSPELERPKSSGVEKKRKSPVAFLPFPPASNGPETRPKSPEVPQDNQSVGLQIERPRSALHRGDFREKEQTQSSFEHFGSRTPIREEAPPALSTSPVAPWHPQFPTAAHRQSRQELPPQTAQSGVPIPQPARYRAASNASLAASFIYQAPTSPLVQSSRPDTPPPARGQSRSPDKGRRHTFSPQSFHRFQSALDYPTSVRAAPPLRSEKSFPYQAHQPRRSVNTASFSSLPQTPIAGTRRPSFSTDSPLHHAPMVGSYEESILRGRMSTTPSKPLNFMAQIGVLGRGDCKPNLRCPPHVQIPFPAVFYSYGTGSKMPANDQPSPYVGLVDIENNLPNPDQAQQDRRRNRLQESFSNEGSRASSPAPGHGSNSDETRRRRRTKAKRRSGSPKAPPGGSYRIPQQGQLQIVLKNPNKTAVKLFLVPYDLSDMEPGQKTFIRQRSYSAGPIIDMPLTSRKNLGTDRPEAAINATGDPNDRPMLRYLVHLHICCPSKGRYFLYKSIRVVFANRVPDGKEKLRNEIQMPEPRYSTYKPGRDSIANGPTKDLERRRSAIDSRTTDPRWQHLAQSLPSTEYPVRQRFDAPIPSLPRNFTTLPTLDSRPGSRAFSDSMDLDSTSQDTPSVRSPISPTASSGDISMKTAPRLDDPFNFERDRSREGRNGNRSESLLSQRLMDLFVQNQGSGSTRDGA